MKKFLAAAGFIITIVSIILIVTAYLRSTNKNEYSEDYEWGI